MTNMQSMAEQLTVVQPSSLQIIQQLQEYGSSNLPRVLLNNGELVIIVHETANTNPSAGGQFHANFVDGGGGVANVSFHFTVDKLGAWQMIPLDNVGFHAADGLDNRATDVGGFRGIAIETCVNDPIGSPGWMQTKQNLVALIVAICSGDTRINYGTRSAADLSVGRILPHVAVSDPGPDQHDCPQRMLREGLIDAHTGNGILKDACHILYDRVNQVASAPPKYAPVVGVPFDLASATGWHKLNGLDVFMASFEAVAAKGVVPRSYASSKAPKSGATIPKGSKLIIKGVFNQVDRKQWGLCNDGSRILMSSLVEIVHISKRKEN